MKYFYRCIKAKAWRTSTALQRLLVHSFPYVLSDFFRGKFCKVSEPLILCKQRIVCTLCDNSAFLKEIHPVISRILVFLKYFIIPLGTILSISSSGICFDNFRQYHRRQTRFMLLYPTAPQVYAQPTGQYHRRDNRDDRIALQISAILLLMLYHS